MAKHWMAALAVALMLVNGAVFAGASEEQKIGSATTVLRNFLNIPENAIPPTLLQQAYGIAVVPGVLKVGFIVGGRHGTGVLAVRDEHGAWSNPAFFNLTGGSIGWQLGASSTDLILVFKSKRSIDRIANGDFTLGGDASAAAGPVGRSASAATNISFDAEVYSYSRSRGLFAGISIEGAALSMDHAANADFYGEPGISPSQILGRSDSDGLPQAGREFITTLDRYLPRPRD